MNKTSNRSLSHKKMMPSKLVMSLMVAAVSVLVGTAGVANATSGNSGNGYGGSTGGINISLGNLGDNNIVNIVINYFVGR